MLRELLKFEASLHIRQVSFWLTLVVLVAFGVLMASTDVFASILQGGSKVKANGAQPIALVMGTLSIFGLFFGAVFTVTGVMRDDNHKMVELIHSTPVRSSDLVISRMFGVWMISFLCVFAAVIGMMVARFMPWADAESFQSFNLWHYARPLFLYAVLNSFILSSFFIFVAATTRNKSLVYVSAIALFALSTALGLVLGEDPPKWPSTLLDNFGMNGHMFDVEFWTASEQNAQMTPLTGYFGVNRIVWTIIAIGLTIASYRKFERGIIFRKTKRTDGDAARVTGRTKIAPVSPKTGLAVQVQAFLSRFKFEYLLTVRSTAFLILVGLTIAVLMTVLYVVLLMTPDATLPTSRMMASFATRGFATTIIFIMVFFGSEIIWRDRNVGFHEILDSTAVQNGAIMAAKWAALLAVIYTLIAISMVTAMVAQIILGDVPINLGTYFKVGFVGFGLGFIFPVVLVMFIQTFTPNRVVGMMVSAAALLGSAFIGALSFYHPLMQYGQLKLGNYSEIDGFGDMTDFWWSLTYWLGFALILIALSVWLWRRGLQTKLSRRLRNIGGNIGPLSSGVMALGAVMFIGAGALGFKVYNIDNDYYFKEARIERTIAYEKMVTPYLDLDIPKIRSVETTVDMHPSTRSATFSGRYRIENTTGEPLKTVFVDMASGHDEDRRVLSIAGAMPDLDSEEAVALETRGVRRFDFNPPLPVGAMTDMDFETYFHSPRLLDGSPIRRNGTFINNFAALPQLGIPKNFLAGADRRRKRGLEKRKGAKARTDMKAREDHYIGEQADYVDFSTTFCTDAGQIPIAPGKLIRSYEKDGRACRDYAAVNPILNFFTFMSASHAVKTDVWTKADGTDVQIEMYYYPEHDYNVDRMIKAVKTGLEIYSRDFGPYQYAQVRIIEFPGASFAQAFAGTIPFSEDIGFIRNPGDDDDPDSMDLATYVTLHEMAHQWFAHQIVSANTKGNTILTEGLSEYAALSAYEEMYGYQKARAMLEKDSITNYLTVRSVTPGVEPVLAKATTQQHIHYQKASWVFWGLRHYIGEDAMASAIRHFVTEYGSKGPPYPTTIQLIKTLRDFAGAGYDQLITDYFDRITLWELGFDGSPTLVKAGSNFDVTLTVTIDKKIADGSDGKEESVSLMPNEVLGEWVEIGFYENDPKDTLGDDWIRLVKVNLSEPVTELKYGFETQPNFVLLDPRRLLIERQVLDNVKPLTVETSEASAAGGR